MAAGNVVGAIISLVIGVVMTVNVVIPVVKGTNTSGYTSTELAIYGLITLGCLIGLFVFSFRAFGLA